MSTTLSARIAERFAVEISVYAVFQHPTIREMAELIERLASGALEGFASKSESFEEFVV
jgi:hypothetical protein